MTLKYILNKYILKCTFIIQSSNQSGNSVNILFTVPCQTRFSHRSVWAGLQRRVGILPPFHRSEHPMPTSLQLYCSPIDKQRMRQALIKGLIIWLFRMLLSVPLNGPPQRSEVRYFFIMNTAKNVFSGFLLLILSYHSASSPFTFRNRNVF